MLLESEIEIRKSTIEKAGKGVFTLRNIEQYELLEEYKGRILNSKQYDKKVHHCDYIWEILDKNDDIILYIDGGNKRNSNWTRYVNCPCTKNQENVIPIQKGFKMYYYAKSDIKKGEELFVWYGPEYGKKLIGREKL